MTHPTSTQTRSGLTILITALLLAIAAPSTGFAQEEADDEASENRAAEIMTLFELPGAVEELRQTGMPESEIGEALRAIQNRPEEASDEVESEGDNSEAAANANRRHRRAHDALAAIRAETETAREHGPKENFGAFVQAQVQEEGLRGQALAERIRAEREGRMPAEALERRNAAEERRDNAGERRDNAEERREAAGERREAAGERRDNAEERRDAAEERRDNAEERRDNAEERRGNAEERREAAGARRGATSEDETENTRRPANR